MDAAMVAMFPKGIRALMIDNDTKFLKSATSLLSVMNFDVVRCGSVAHALRSLTNGDLKGFDVILVHAANAAACGFDFRAIVETDLLIPVIYFLEEDHEATSDEADELLRTLQAPGSYVIKKPLDIDEVRTRLWMVIAFRKCDLETKASRGSAGGEDEDRVHFKVVTKGRGRKRKCSSSSKRGGSSGTAVATAAGGHPAAKGKEKENEVGQQQPAQQNEDRTKKGQKNGGGEASSNLPKPNTTTTNGQQEHVQHQPNPSDLFMPSLLRKLAVPPYNSMFFTNNATVPSNNPMFCPGAAGSSSNTAAFGTTTGGAPAAAPLPLYSTAPPALHPVARQQQQPSAHNNVIFGNVVPSSAAAPTMAAAATAAYELQFSQGISSKEQQQEDFHPLLMFGPFPYQCPTPPPPPPVVQQGILAPAPALAGDLFTGGMAGVGMTGGAPDAPATTEAVAYDNNVSLAFLHSPNLGVEQDGAKDIALQTLYPSLAPPMAPQHVVNNASDEVAMLELLLSDSFNNYSAVNSKHDPHPPMLPQHISDDASAGKAEMLDFLFSDDYSDGSSVVTPVGDQAPGMASSLNKLTASAGGAFGSSNAVPLMVSQGPGAAMVPSDHYDEDDNTSFPLEALLGDLHGPMFELDDDADLDAIVGGGSTGGCAASAADDGGAGASLVAGEEGGIVNGLSNLDGIEIPRDVRHLKDLPSPRPKNKNNVC